MFGQIWIIESRDMIFKGFINFCVGHPLRWHSSNICDVTTVQLSNRTVHKFLQIFFSSWKCIFPLFLYLGTLGLRWMCMHLWMNVIKRTIDIQEKLKYLKIYVQSQCRVVLLWYHIFWQSSIQRGRHTQLCIISSLKWIIQICSNFYCWVCKIAFYSPNPHCCLGKLPL